MGLPVSQVPRARRTRRPRNGTSRVSAAASCFVERVTREARSMPRPEKVAVVEIKGVDRKSAAESHARQLEQWVSAYDAAHEDVKAKGILIVNTFKDTPLRDRTEVSFPTQMRPYSEAREHCLMTGLQLLGIYLDYKDNEVKKQEMIERIFATKGIFSEYQNWTDFLIDENAETPA